LASHKAWYSLNGQSQQSSYNPFGGAAGGSSSQQQGPSSNNNALVNLDASSLVSSNPHQQMAQENAIKNPFAPKLQAQNTGGSGKFQWDSKPAPMTLAQMAAANSSGGGSIGRSNTMPNAMGGQAPLFGSGAPNASWTQPQQAQAQQQQQFGQGGAAFGQQAGQFGGQMVGGYPQQQQQQSQQQFGGPFGGQQQPQQPQFGTPFQHGQQQQPQQQQFQQNNQNQFPGQKPNGYQSNLF
jgi:hypothetical protein